jgi:tetratricopeptide (TPR) repeat protein
VLVTSRDSLPGLVARNGARRLCLDPLPPGDAVTLLQALIGERASTDPPATSRLAEQCARLPLALRVAAELAVGRPAMTLAQLTGELADEQRRLDLLDAGGDPQTAVRGVFSWSYRRLPSDAARSFRLIGLHPGPDLDIHAAAALAGVTAERARDIMKVLTRTHLLSQVRPGRYTMHDLLRAYAIQLGLTHDGTAPLTRLFDYYLATAAAAMDVLVPAERSRRPVLRPPPTSIPPMTGAAEARTWLDAERATLVSVAVHTAARGWHSHTTRLSAIVCRYVETGGHYTDAVTIHSHARRAARESGDRVAEAHALNHLGYIEGRRGRYPLAAGYLELSLALFGEAGDRCGAARARSNLAAALWRQGRYPAAAAHLEQALAVFRQIGDQIGEARALNGLGLVDWQRGCYPQAAGHFQQALALFRIVGDHSNEAHALGNLGMTAGRLHQGEQAARCLRQALARFSEIGDRSGAASVLTDLGCVACQQGRYREATHHHRQALALFREIGERAGEAEALNGLGEVLLATAKPGPARVQHTAAMAVARHIGDRHEQARAHNGLGAALLAAGRPAQARAQHEAALTLASQSGDRYEQTRAQDGIAVCTDRSTGPARQTVAT